MTGPVDRYDPVFKCELIYGAELEILNPSRIPVDKHDGPRLDYHWHWELLPRTTGIAGFELSCGWFLNPLPPEQAAENLRRST